MQDMPSVPDSLTDKVISVEALVTSNEVDIYGRLREIEDQSYKLRTVLQTWERQQTEERKLRGAYAKWLLVGMFAQMALVNIAFLAISLGWIVVEKWVAIAFILAVFGEIIGMTTVVIKYLFPQTRSEVLALIEKL